MPSFGKTREEAGILPTLRVEGYTDDDYNDVVIKIPSYAQTSELKLCDCGCTTAGYAIFFDERYPVGHCGIVIYPRPCT